MKKLFLGCITILMLNACTPGIGFGIPLGPIGYVGVGVNKKALFALSVDTINLSCTHSQYFLW